MKEAKKEYLVKDIAGCRVETETGELIGMLEDVYPTGSNDVFVVRGEREYLIPALKDVVISVDIEDKKIVVKLPAGLREIYE